MQRGKWPIIAVFLAPTLLLYGVFVIIPYAGGIAVSFTNWAGFSAQFTFVGVENYVQMVQDPVWRLALLHNVIMLIVLPVIALGIALAFASLLTQGGTSAIFRRIYGSQFYRIAFFLPYMMPVSIVAILWQFVYSPTFGLLNGFLRLVHLNGLTRTWLGDPSTALGAVAVVGIWSIVGFYMVLFMAGIQGIPTDMFEAAAIDGASRVQMFFRVTIPLLWSQLQVAIVYVGIYAFDLFALVQIMSSSQAGPNNATQVMGFYLYQTAFSYSHFGYASAMGVAIFILSIALTLFTFRFTTRQQVEF
ncbi:MAG: sugar ABC transporter permease [Candidatus Dormiibacterota bacterium]